MEKLDRKMIIESLQEVEEYILPQSSDKNLVLYYEAECEFSEQYRVLCSKIIQTTKKKKLKKIGITSAIKGEGKTLTSSNLAFVLADVFSKRVCLLDLDMKDPRVQKYWGSGKTIRFQEVLEDNRSFVDAALKLLDGRLIILPCGASASQQIDILTSKKLELFFAMLDDVFDFVIVDTPPVLPVVDTQLIMDYLDGILFVIRGGETPRDLVTKGIEIIGEKLVGIVLNGVDHLGYYKAKYMRYPYQKR